jgi:hypothetical protein
MTRHLSDAVWGVSYGTDGAMLAAAEEALSRCSFVGLYESLDADMRKLQAVLGLPLIKVPRLNARPRDSAVGGEERARIEAANKLDMMLYQSALTLRSSYGGPVGQALTRNHRFSPRASV